MIKGTVVTGNNNEAMTVAKMVGMEPIPSGLQVSRAVGKTLSTVT
jgi:hypothetical protein